MSIELADRLEEALRLCHAGAFKQAEQIYRELVVADPAAPDAWNMLAVVLYQQGELEEAHVAAARATQLRPLMAPYWLVQGNIALAQRRHRDAQASFHRAIDITPSYAEAHYRLGLSYHQEFRYASAAAAYRQALSHAPDVAEIHAQLADALLADGRPDEAIGAYQEAYSRDPRGELDRAGCLECLTRLRFESLPRFWSDEIGRIFRRDDIDRALYVSVGLKALKTKLGFQAVLARAANPELQPDVATLCEAVGDPLFHVLLRDCLIADADFERFLTRLRACLLIDGSLLAKVSANFLCAFALQGFNNGYIYAESEPEARQVDALMASLPGKLKLASRTDDETVRALLILAAYRPLTTLENIEALTRTRLSPAFDELLQRSVIDVATEKKLRSEIVPVGAVTDSVSREVRAMYEEHPYPRWFHIVRGPQLSYAEWAERQLRGTHAVRAETPARILVAGCGTGRDAIWIASNVADTNVLAIDLSLSSLAYAKRVANLMAVTNLELRQGDILGLDRLSDRFDMISSTGVLHHMRDPMAGLRVLAGLLRPGGIMQLGLYSERARAAVNAARDIISGQQITATEAEIREFRQVVLRADESSPLKGLQSFNDFYAMSTCRDLMFHVQEHQFRWPQIAAMLKEASLEFLGLTELQPSVIDAYRQMFPEDPAMLDLLKWDVLEAHYPDTFRGMYYFWCRRPAA